MKNVINYYYNLNPNKVSKIFNYYYFYLDNELYNFIIYTRREEDVLDIFEFNRELINNNVLVNEIISNKDGNVITLVGDVPYVLVKVDINQNKDISLEEINYLSNLRVKYSNGLMRSNWANLWSEKIDYLELQLEQNYQKYPLISESFNYFIGLSENAIAYINNTIQTLIPTRDDIGVISHDRFSFYDTVYSLYDPMNIIIDHKARDLAEYIKISFFRDNFKIFEELDEYFKHNYFSFYGMNLLMARILYPSFYFELYDNVINKLENENKIVGIISRIDEYEDYLYDVFCYLRKYYNIQEVSWLKKRD